MKYFTTVHDINSVDKLVSEALALKQNPYTHTLMGKNKTLGLIFMNPSLRTRLSTQKAAQNLGMQVITMNVNQDGWALEYDEGIVMNGNKSEHIKDAAAVMGSYCDIIGLRCFPQLMNRQEDYSEKILLQFMKYSGKPVVSLESATLHPLQSLADAMTIREFHKGKPKIVLTWAPHVKALPQAVPNSFAEWMLKSEVEFSVACPEGYELNSDYTKDSFVTNNQEEALKEADFIYVKNWSSYEKYGTLPFVKDNWLLNEQKLKHCSSAFIMHCLPVRRNVELSDELIDSKRSLIQIQAENRIYAAQAVLKNLLETNFRIQDPTTKQQYGGICL